MDNTIEDTSYLLAAMSGYRWHNYTANPLPDRKDITSRLDTFVGGRYAQWNLSHLNYADKRHDGIELTCWDPPGRSKPTFEEAKRMLNAGKGHAIQPGYQFGPSWTQHWVKAIIRIPSSWKSAEQVELIFDPSCEAMVFNQDGVALQGITGGFDYNRRVEYIIPEKEVRAGVAVRYLEVSANGVFGMQPNDPPLDNRYYTVGVGSVNLEARRLSWDFEVLRSLAEVLPNTSPLGNKARTLANEIMDVFDDTLKSVPKCRKVAEGILGSNWEDVLEQERKADGSGQVDGTLWALGYCHIDTAWLWPWSATEQKVARTWSSQLALSDKYPEFRFMASAAQHYSWLEKLYPAVFKKLSDKVKDGKMDVNGACWVEMDGNMPSGESFCRQFLYGQSYFKSHFGIECDTLLLPDTFGFSGALPQIARLSGCVNYFTHKLNWSRDNEFPLTTFNWVGLDGTQLLSHITPIGRYDSDCSVAEIDRAYKRHKNLDACEDSLLLFGYGDGGGGPNQVMLERLRRTRAAGLHSDRNGEGLPLVKTGFTLSEFFDNLREKTKNGTKVPDWNGELYLENHRGCYTSQSRTKRNFRKSEILLREVELLSTIASLRTNYTYPKDRIDAVWQGLCLCMFHDTLPGSSIHLAVEDYDKKFAWIQEQGQELVQDALHSLSARASIDTPGYLNTLLSHPRREVVALPNGSLEVVDFDDGVMVATSAKFLLADQGVAIRQQEDDSELGNSNIKMTVKHGRITSLYDIAEQRELVPEGRTAGFVMFEDRPDDGDAWEVRQYSAVKRQDVNFDSCHVVVQNKLRSTIECTLRYGQSTATVKITLDALPASTRAGARSMIRFDTTIDWHERHRLLKFELPLDLWAQEATYDTAFGVQRRATHRNTSWEMTKYEVPAHKFADYSEWGYGVAIINDCKYGYAIQGNVMQISLLRAPTQPDQEADQGRHQFSIAIYPHVGGFVESDVQAVAHAFNSPIKSLDRILCADAAPIVMNGSRNIMLETIKRGETDFGTAGGKTVICRLHENMGGHGRARLTIRGLRVSKAELVNVLEDHMTDLDIVTDLESEGIDLNFRAFEIKTVKLYIE